MLDELSTLPGAVELMVFMGTASTHDSAQLYIGASNLITIDTNGGTSAVSNSTPSTGAWHHVVGTWDGTTLKLYVDGTLQTTTATPGSANLSYGSLTLGSQAGSAYYFAGSLDEVAIYSTALTGTRITAHYNAGYRRPAVRMPPRCSLTPGAFVPVGDPTGSITAADTISPSAVTLMDAGGNMTTPGQLNVGLPVSGSTSFLSYYLPGKYTSLERP